MKVAWLVLVLAAALLVFDAARPAPGADRAHAPAGPLGPLGP